MGYILDLRKIVGHRPLIQVGAGIIVEDDKGRVLLQLRADNHCWGYCGGSIEPDEKVEDAAKRELFEETGLIAESWEKLTVLETTPGFCNERIHLYLATGLKQGETHPDEDEFVAAEWVDLSVLVDSVLDGRIEDSKTVIAALICDAIRSRM